MITLMEIAIYAVILSGNTPLTCVGYDHERVTCSNGLSAEVLNASTLAYSNGVTVDRNGGLPLFSNGTRSWLDSAGWVAFSTGIQARRVNPDYFKFSTGLECRTQLPKVVKCS